MNMDPMNRKLFKSRDARNKLRGMGGIVASSPELAQTVQQYQAGGRVTGLDQMEQDNVSKARATRIGGNTYLMLPSGVVLDAATRSPVGGEETLAVQRKLNAFPGRDPVLSEENLALRVNPSFGTDTRDRAVGIGVADRMPSPPTVDTTPGFTSATDVPVADISALLTAPNMPAPSGSGDLEGLGLRGMSPERLEAERLAAESGGLKELGLDIAEGITGGVRNTGEFLQRNIGEGLSRMGAPGVGSFFLEGAESTAELSTRRQQDEKSRDAERAARIAEIDEIRGVETGEPLQFDPARDMPPASAATPEPEPEVEVAAPIEEEVVDTPDVEDPASDFDVSYENAMKRLGGVMGKGSDEDSKKKAMANLAMIGLAIASGQSPNALTNIAQGALTGMQGIKKAEAAEEAQRKELELAAIKMAADEVALDKRLASDKTIADMRKTGDGGFSKMEPYATAVVRVANSLIGEGVPVTEAFSSAKAQLDPLYGRSNPNELIKILKPLNDAAKKAGKTEYEYDGYIYRVQ